MTTKTNPFIINVRWAFGEAPGTSHVIDFDFPSFHFEPDLDLENLTGAVTAVVAEDGIMVNGDLTAETTLECTRCLERFVDQLKIAFTELYVHSRPLGESEDEVDVEVHQLSPDGIIDVKPHFRQYALLSIPSRHVCSSDCKGLCPTCGSNLNHEDCGHTQEKIDPRMAVLKQLLDEEE